MRLLFVVMQAATKPSTPVANGHANGFGNGSAERKQGSAFRRVDDDFWTQQIKDQGLMDNSCTLSSRGVGGLRRKSIDVGGLDTGSNDVADELASIALCACR